MVKHSGRKHALLSASGASRWINCPPSALMEEGQSGDSSESEYAKEGTLAHEFADLSLRIQSYTGANEPKIKWTKEREKLRSNPLYTDDMEDHVKVYTDYVLEQWLAAKKQTPDAVLSVEEKVDFSYLVPEGFGTTDANIIADRVLEVVDLKYGKGVKVNAKGNPQGRLYALGALRKYQLFYDIDTVKITIVQPRLDHIETETISVGDLISWSEETVRPAADKAFKGEGTCNPGDWCRWCKAKPVCRAIAEHNTALAAKEFADPKTLSDKEVIEMYEQSSLLLDWANSVASYILETAKEGKKWPGYKIVEGKSNRKWADEAKALEVLQEEGFTLEQITNTKIKGIGDTEKLVGKGFLEEYSLTIKPQGAPTLAPESDKRPAMGIEQAKKDFE